MKRHLSSRPVVTTVAAAVTIALVQTAGASAAPGPSSGSTQDAGAVVQGTTSAGDADAWAPLPDATFGPDDDGAVDASVVVDPATTDQEYSGIGFSIDETAVSNLWKLPEDERRATVEHLVSPTDGAGLDRFRITIGSPDLIEHMPFWSYDELPDGVTDDFDLEHFSVQKDIDFHIVDTIKLIQEYNPDATFFASAWSAPAWMTTSNTFTGYVEPNADGTGYVQASRLRDDCIDVFARYYVKFLQSYAELGIDVDAITMLNEPGMDVVYPAMDISVPQQQKLALAIDRELDAAGLDTELWAHDFNFWDWRDPNSTETKNYHRIFDDSADGTVKGADVLAAVDAVAFHPYWGEPSVMRDARAETGLPVHLTETSDFEPATIIDDLRLGAGSYIAWAQITDQDGGTLHWTDARDNDVDWDEVAATSKWKDRLVTVDTDAGTSSFKPILGGLGQLARYLEPGDVRVGSSGTSNGVSNVVFRDDDAFTAVLQNTAAEARTVRVALGEGSFTTEVPAASVSTFTWEAATPSAEGNHAPELAPVDDVTVEQGGTAEVQLTATDADDDALRYYGLDLPDGVEVDPASGVVSLTPTASGTSPLRFVVTDGAASAEVSATLTVTPRAVPVGERIEAEAYAEQTGWAAGGSFIETTPGASGGRNVGYTAEGNTLTYLVDVPADGTYDVELGVARGEDGDAADALALRDEAGTDLATVTVPATGGWATYQPVTTTIELAAGEQRITVHCNTGGFNLDYLEITAADAPPAAVATTTALSTRDVVVHRGQPVRLTARVAADDAEPTGTVTFRTRQGDLGTADLDGGRASFTADLRPGLHFVTATYDGSDAATASTSRPRAVLVLPW